MEQSHDAVSPQRARRSLWLLVLLAIASAGSLSAALVAPTGAITGVRVAISGLVLIVSIALATRVLMVLERARRRG